MRRWLPDTEFALQAPTLPTQLSLAQAATARAERQHQAIQAIQQPVEKHALTTPHECQDAGDVIRVADGWARICLRHQWLSGTFHSADWARDESCVKCAAELDAVRGESRYRALHALWARG